MLHCKYYGYALPLLARDRIKYYERLLCDTMILNAVGKILRIWGVLLHGTSMHAMDIHVHVHVYNVCALISLSPQRLDRYYERLSFRLCDAMILYAASTQISAKKFR